MEQLKRIREAKGLTQSRLSEKSGVAQSFISDVEAGRAEPTLRTLRRLADALGISVAQLIANGGDELNDNAADGRERRAASGA